MIKEPTRGDNTPLQKFKVPVKNAKQVASIDVGVIFANKTIVGSYIYARLRVPRTTFVNTVKIKSDMPIYRFHLKI